MSACSIKHIKGMIQPGPEELIMKTEEFIIENDVFGPTSVTGASW